MTPLLALGPNVFETLPMTLQKIEEESRALWPGVHRFGVGPARQFTGLGESQMTIEGLIFNQEFGGYGDYLALKETQRLGQPVDMIGWGAAAAFAGVFGAVCIVKVGATHEYIHQSGIGRKLTFAIEVVPFGEGGIGGLF